MPSSLSSLSRQPCATADGSSTLYIPALDEHYHSVAGALTESSHVYIRSAFEWRIATAPCHAPLRVLEFGLGTGMDALLLAHRADQVGVQVHYTALELYPLTIDELRQLQPTLDPLMESIHRAQWNEDVALTSQLTIRKFLIDFCEFVDTSTERFDVIFYDAFAPEKQPELWTPDHLAQVVALLSPGGVLTTYCAKGVVRRAFAATGATVERIPGPPGGKREILRVTQHN